MILSGRYRFMSINIPNGKEDFLWLDWFRFIAASLVVTGHLKAKIFAPWNGLDESSRTFSTAIFYAITRLGTEGVTVFFVLSGFLVGGRLIERMKQGNLDLRRYAIDRFARIYVPLIPAIALTVSIAYYLNAPPAAWDIIGNVFSIQGVLASTLPFNGPLWSLTYEVWFYIGAGALTWFLVSRRPAALILTFLTFAIFTILESHLAFCWIAGAICFQARAKKQPRVEIVALSAILACSMIILRQLASGGAMQSSWSQPEIERVTLLLFAFGFACFISQIVSTPAPNSGGFGRLYRAGTFLAAFSYTLYLVHEPLFSLAFKDHIVVKHISTDGMVLYAASMIGIMTVAYLVYLLFEKHTNLFRLWLLRQFEIRS
ncbi:MAG: acyltransferase [Hydrogenophaga sp.]|nr:acyltransferase [Hydrogenophaga sp.]